MSNNTIHAAARSGDAKLLATLLKEGVPVDSPDLIGCPPLVWATRGMDDWKSAACIKILLAARANVNYKLESGSTALHDAALYNNSAAISLLLDAGADVEARTSKGRTPLYQAISGFGYQPVKLLLDHGARIENILIIPFVPPQWAKDILSKREHCRRAVVALYRVLRKRYRVDGQRIPKDMVKMLANCTYNTRYHDTWEVVPK